MQKFNPAVFTCTMCVCDEGHFLCVELKTLHCPKGRCGPMERENGSFYFSGDGGFYVCYRAAVFLRPTRNKLQKGRSILIALCLFFFPAGECCFGLLNDDYKRGARSHAFGGCAGGRKTHGGSFSEAAANKRAFQALCKGFIIAGCRSIPLQGESFLCVRSLCYQHQY